MHHDGRPAGEAIHATAVSVAGDGLLIIGPSGSGKSRLALSLIAASTPRRPVRLVGDDRVLLLRAPHGLVARGHPRIEGFIERRGLGIQAVPFVASAPVRGIVRLGYATSPPSVLENFPCLSIVTLEQVDSARDQVLLWWRDASTTQAAKPLAVGGRGAKD